MRDAMSGAILRIPVLYAAAWAKRMRRSQNQREVQNTFGAKWVEGRPLLDMLWAMGVA